MPGAAPPPRGTVTSASTIATRSHRLFITKTRRSRRTRTSFFLRMMLRVLRAFVINRPSMCPLGGLITERCERLRNEVVMREGAENFDGAGLFAVIDDGLRDTGDVVASGEIRKLGRLDG